MALDVGGAPAASAAAGAAAAAEVDGFQPSSSRRSSWWTGKGFQPSGKGKDCDAYLILTDGCAPKPAPSRKRRGWVVVPDQKLIFDKDGNDVLIQMKGLKKAAA